MADNTVEAFIDQWGQASLLWQRLRRPILVKEGLTQTDKRILYGLYRLKTATKKDLAQAVVLEHSSLTRSLDRLEKKGWVGRVINQEDKRYIELSLTKLGVTKTKYIKDQSVKLAKKLFADVSKKEIDQATQVFKHIRAVMEDQF